MTKAPGTVDFMPPEAIDDTPEYGPPIFKFCIRQSVTLCAECEQKNPIEKPFKFCIHRSVTLCPECEQKNPREKPFKFCIRRSVTLCAECEQKNPIDKPF